MRARQQDGTHGEQSKKLMPCRTASCTDATPSSCVKHGRTTPRRWRKGEGTVPTHCAHLVHRLKHATQRRRAKAKHRYAQAGAPERPPRQQGSHPVNAETHSRKRRRASHVADARRHGVRRGCVFGCHYCHVTHSPGRVAVVAPGSSAGSGPAAHEWFCRYCGAFAQRRGGSRLDPLPPSSAV